MHTQSASGPRGPEVNVLALDELVTEYLRAQVSPCDALGRASVPK